MATKIFIGNLPFSATDAMLFEIFNQIGPVQNAHVIQDQMTGRSRGFGFVEMASPQDADNAVQKFNGADFEGRAITVSVAKEQGSNRRRL